MRGLRKFRFALAILAGFGSVPAAAQFDAGVPVELVRWFSERSEVYAGLPPDFPDFTLPQGMSALAFQDRGPLQHVVLDSSQERAAARDAIAEALLERGWQRVDEYPDDEFRPVLLCEDAQGSLEVSAGRTVVSLRRYLPDGRSCQERYPPPRTVDVPVAGVEEARLIEIEPVPAPADGENGTSPPRQVQELMRLVAVGRLQDRSSANPQASPPSPPAPVATRGYGPAALLPYEGELPLEAAVLLAGGGEFDDGFPDNFPRLNLPAGVTLRGSLDQTTRQQLAFATRPQGDAAQTALAVDLLARDWKILPPAMTDPGAPGLTLCHDAFGTLYLEGGYEPNVLYLRRSIIDRHQPFCAF